jgi:hypothetical protein
VVDLLNVKMGNMGEIGEKLKQNIESRRGTEAQVPRARGKDERQLNRGNVAD